MKKWLTGLRRHHFTGYYLETDLIYINFVSNSFGAVSEA